MSRVERVAVSGASKVMPMETPLSPRTPSLHPHRMSPRGRPSEGAHLLHSQGGLLFSSTRGNGRADVRTNALPELMMTIAVNMDVDVEKVNLAFQQASAAVTQEVQSQAGLHVSGLQSAQCFMQFGQGGDTLLNAPSLADADEDVRDELYELAACLVTPDEIPDLNMGEAARDQLFQSREQITSQVQARYKMEVQPTNSRSVQETVMRTQAAPRQQLQQQQQAPELALKAQNNNAAADAISERQRQAEKRVLARRRWRLARISTLLFGLARDVRLKVKTEDPERQLSGSITARLARAFSRSLSSSENKLRLDSLHMPQTDPTATVSIDDNDSILVASVSMGPSIDEGDADTPLPVLHPPALSAVPDGDLSRTTSTGGSSRLSHQPSLPAILEAPSPASAAS